ncbi:retrovirus-related pol polyprotein from transposon TNT 1-94 [Tanacetum coccineum]|uniref:Retrovirus-related pol polyprotein from transposon TNT 1-94 n=1 Tax=Tanacetum coccineum TaxID=301880 RepID=A0ABQ5D931_9ASTR
MQEELNQFISNDVWELVPNPKDMTIIGTKWVFRNKLDENGVVSRNKARLVAQGYNQQEGIDYDETYALVPRLESIRILLAFACALDFKLFQMDVKSAFLNGFINEEVYVAQPPGFIDFAKPNHVYRLKKALYGLKQAPKAWYDRLKAFLIKHDYTMGMVDNTLFTKKKDPNLIIVQIYVDDIIFGSTCQEMCDDFAKIMHDEFEMKMLKKFGLEDSKPMKTPISTETKLTKDVEGLWYPKGSDIETIVYADSDHAGDYVDQKHTSSVCTFMGCCLKSWFSKKQTALAISTTEAEYVSAGKACQQALWMKQALVDYGISIEERRVSSKITLDGVRGILSEIRDVKQICMRRRDVSFHSMSIKLNSYKPHFLTYLSPHVANMLHAQSSPSPQGDNHTQPLLPPSPSREMLMNDINQLQDLSNLLAMHLLQRNTSSSPYSLNLPHTLNLDQVEQHNYISNLVDDDLLRKCLYIRDCRRLRSMYLSFHHEFISMDHEHEVLNLDSAGTRLQRRHLYLKINVSDKQQIQFKRVSLTGFPAQSVRSSNAIALDSLYLLVLITGASQSRQHGKSESVSYFLTD